MDLPIVHLRGNRRQITQVVKDARPILGFEHIANAAQEVRRVSWWLSRRPYSQLETDGIIPEHGITRVWNCWPDG